jgi:hypothetical protein
MIRPKLAARSIPSTRLRTGTAFAAFAACALPAAATRAQEASAGASPVPATPIENVESVELASATKRKQERQLVEGVAVLAGSYLIAATMGGVLLSAGANSKAQVATQSWGLPLLVPVLGPIYVGGRLAVEYTAEWKKTKYMAPLAAMFAPFAYATALFSMVDGVLQAYGIARIATAHTPSNARLFKNQDGRTLAQRIVPPQISLTPSASSTAVRFDLSGRF